MIPVPCNNNLKLSEEEKAAGGVHACFWILYILSNYVRTFVNALQETKQELAP